MHFLLPPHTHPHPIVFYQLTLLTLSYFFTVFPRSHLILLTSFYIYFTYLRYHRYRRHLVSQEIVIESPPGNVIGFVKQDPTFCIPKLTVYDADKTTPLIKIVGPCCPIACCADIEFQVRDVVSGESARSHACFR